MRLFQNDKEPKLKGDMLEDEIADVIIIGGGHAGLPISR